MSDLEDSPLQLEDLTQEEPKLLSKTSSKKQNSYTYWVDQNNKSRILPPQQRPQKIDPPKVSMQKAEDGRSNWNTAGTWEHRKVSLRDIEKIYSEKLHLWISQNCPDVKLKKVSLKGECEVIFTRNKKAVTYQIHGKVQFQKILPEVNQTNIEESSEQKNSPISENMSQESSQSDNTSDKSLEKKPSSQRSKLLKSNPRTMTFEITDLTDHGDRECKSKADNADDKKFMNQKCESLLQLLEEVLKSFK